MHIGNLRPWNLYSVLTQKYLWPSEKARQFADFLEPMLDYDKRKRATAWQCLNHPWITGSVVVGGGGLREVVSSSPTTGTIIMENTSTTSSSSPSSSSKKSQSQSPGRYDLQQHYSTYRPSSKLERGIFSAPAYGRRQQLQQVQPNALAVCRESMMMMANREISKSAKNSSPRYYAIEKIVEGGRGSSRKK